MYPKIDFIRDIVILTVAPLLYSILFFRYFIRLSNKTKTHNDRIFLCFISGASFICFEIIQSSLVVAWGYISYGMNHGFGDFDLFRLLGDIFGLVMGYGLVYSWDWVINYPLNGIVLTDRLAGFPPAVQLIYFLFYSLVGLVMMGGDRLRKHKLPIKIIGLTILITSYLVYTVGLYIWMVTAMYL